MDLSFVIDGTGKIQFPSASESVYEPFLLKEGLIVRSPRGRILTEAGYEHIGLVPSHVIETPEKSQAGLWSS